MVVFRRVKLNRIAVLLVALLIIWKLATLLQEGENDPSIIEATVKPRIVRITGRSAKDSIFVRVDNDLLLESLGTETDRGIHVVVLNEVTGSKMAHRVFDTYLVDEDSQLLDFLDGLRPGRLLVFTLKDEGSHKLGSALRNLLQDYGSQHSTKIGWRDTWAMVAFKNGPLVQEMYRANTKGFEAWAGPAELEVTVQLKAKEQACNFGRHSDVDGHEEQLKQAFCSKYEGYGAVCSCFDSEPLIPQHVKDGAADGSSSLTSAVASIPVAVIASDRPSYLFRGLRSLLSAHGVKPKMITVFIDGHYEESTDVVRLFGLRAVQHTPVGIKNARISQHYRASLTATFNLHGTAKYAIIIEEDMEVSPDFFSYFSQTMRLLHEDSSVYCISAWNDHGYSHSSYDPTLLYRVETMPGLGWMLSRKLYKDELEPQWPSPDKLWDWDMWMRNEGIRKSRECIIPDVSRSYHFGAKGLNMNPYFHSEYFKDRVYNKVPNVVLKDVSRLSQNGYELLLNDVLSDAEILDHAKDPCAANFIPNKSNQTYLLFIKMSNPKDFETFKMLARKDCFHLWDIDIRGYHKSMWRIFLKTNHVVIIGYPASPYSSYKPDNITPIYIPLPVSTTSRGIS